MFHILCLMVTTRAVLERPRCQDLALRFPGISRTKLIFGEFPCPGNFTNTIPGLSRRRGNPDHREAQSDDETFHAPVVDGRVCSQSNSVDSDPLPELDVLGHRVRLHFALHLNVEDLQRLGRCPYTQTQLHAPLHNTYQATFTVLTAAASCPRQRISSSTSIDGGCLVSLSIRRDGATI